MHVTPLDDRVSVSPQVLPGELSLLAARGFRVIVNNRPDGEAADQPGSDELEREALRQGLQYFHLPVTPGGMTDSNVQDFVQILAGTEGPVLAFCRSGARSTKLWECACAAGGREG